MKHLLGSLILFLSLNLYAATPKEEMTTLMNQSAKTWNQGDLKGFVNIYKNSEDTLYISTRIVKGYANISKRFIEKYSNHPLGKLDFTIDDVNALSDQYRFVIGTFHLARKGMPDANGVFSLLFEKVDDQWKIVTDHTSKSK